MEFRSNKALNIVNDSDSYSEDIEEFRERKE